MQYLQGQAGHAVEIFVINPGQAANPLQAQGEAIFWCPDGQHSPVQIAVPVRSRFPDATAPQILPSPKVPFSASWLAAHAGTAVTVPAQSGGARWRVAVFRQSFPNLSGGLTTGTVVIGVDVTSVYNTINELVSIDLIVSAIVIVAMAIIGVAIVRSQPAAAR